MKICGYAALKPSPTLEPFSYLQRTLNPFEILVEVSHCGLCHTDLHMMENGWKRSTYPLLPGHEIVGKVIEKGESSIRNLGERVAIGWIHSTCFKCDPCLQGDTNICQNKQGIYSQGHFGGFASHVIVDSRFAFLVPTPLASELAAPLLCAGATVFAPLSQRLQNPASRVGIIGIGGLGHLALQFGVKLGHEMIAISSSKKKKEDARQLGASSFYTFDLLPPPSSLDFLLCTADTELPWNQLLSLLRPNGTLCFVSRPQRVLFDPSLIVSTQRTLCGSNNANRKTIEEMLEFSVETKIVPWVETMPLHQINEGIAKLRRNEARYRIVFEIPRIS